MRRAAVLLIAAASVLIPFRAGASAMTGSTSQGVALPVELGMPTNRTVPHFSCGAASAVATKLTLADYPAECVVILNAFVEEEDADNRRFLLDCERWFGHSITVLRDEKFGASVREVWRRKRFMNSHMGAPCSSLLKHTLLDAVALPDDLHVLGYTVEEMHRAERFISIRPTMRVSTPLIDRNLTHADCLAIIERAGIVIPRMYRLGYRNANCIGCCKGGEGYWNKIRVDFPDVFIEVSAIEESIGPNAYMFRNRKTGERFGLAQLPPDAGRFESEPEISCSFFCDMAEQDISASLTSARNGAERVPHAAAISKETL